MGQFFLILRLPSDLKASARPAFQPPLYHPPPRFKSLSQFHWLPPPRGSRSTVGVVSLPREILVQVSMFRDSIVCPACQLSQYERGNGKCRRCHRSLGFIYIELHIPGNSLDPQFLSAERKELGRLSGVNYSFPTGSSNCRSSAGYCDFCASNAA